MKTKEKENKAEFFNLRAAIPENKSDAIIKSLNLLQGQKVMDYGSGGGYFSELFAQNVGNSGKVFCLDVNPDLLNFIKQNIKFDNINTILYNGQDIPLPETSLDLIFMRNVTHHIKNRSILFQKLKNYLNTEGKIAIIDFKPKKNIFSFYGIFGHSLKKEIIENEMKKAGLEVSESFDFLNDQHFTIFKKSQ